MRWRRFVGFIFLSGCLTIGDCGPFFGPDMSLPRCPTAAPDGTRCPLEGDVCALDAIHTCTCGNPTWSCDYFPDLSSPRIRDLSSPEGDLSSPEGDLSEVRD